MKQENFKRAQEIQDELKSLRSHLDRLIKHKAPYELTYQGRSENDYYDRINMKFELLPIEINTFMDLYKMNIEKKIKELETEFENL